MAKIISVANQKGGVLKTSSTFNLAAALALEGKKVLMIDNDSQASLTISAGLEPLDFENNITTILMEKNPTKKIIDKCIVSIEAIENLSLIPSIIDLASLELKLVNRTARESILKRALLLIENDFDIILIDCPPQLSILTINALTASGYIIVPCKTDYLSYRGLELLTNTVQDIKRLVNENLQVIGVIATLFEKNVKDQIEVLEALNDKYTVIGIIKKTAEATKGMYDGLPVVIKNPKSEVAIEYKNIAVNHILCALDKK